MALPGLSQPPGHLFVVQTDLRRLACDAVAIPTGRGFGTASQWFAEPPEIYRAAFCAHKIAPSISRCDFTTVKHHGPTRYWVQVTGGKGPTGLAQLGAEYVRRAAADLRSRDETARPANFRHLHLLALPVLGTGAGGQRGHSGMVIGQLLPALAEAARAAGVDVVLVAFSDEDYAAAQRERQRLYPKPELGWKLPPSLLKQASQVAARARAQELVFFLGAGVSVGAGLPMWGSLMDELAAEVGLGKHSAAAALAEAARAAEAVCAQVAGCGVEECVDAARFVLDTRRRGQAEAEAAPGLRRQQSDEQVAENVIDMLDRVSLALDDDDDDDDDEGASSVGMAGRSSASALTAESSVPDEDGQDSGSSSGGEEDERGEATGGRVDDDDEAEDEAPDAVPEMVVTPSAEDAAAAAASAGGLSPEQRGALERLGPRALVELARRVLKFLRAARHESRLIAADREELWRLDYLDMAGIIAQRMEERGLQLGDKVAEALSVPWHSLSHALLANVPVKETVTTNFDTLYEQALGCAGKSVSVLPHRPDRSADGWLLKMHGCVSRPESIVLTRASYLRYQADYEALGGMLQSVLMTKHVLFVGFSLNDPNFHRLFEACRRALRMTHKPTGAGTAQQQSRARAPAAAAAAGAEAPFDLPQGLARRARGLFALDRPKLERHVGRLERAVAKRAERRARREARRQERIAAQQAKEAEEEAAAEARKEAEAVGSGGQKSLQSALPAALRARLEARSPGKEAAAGGGGGAGQRAAAEADLLPPSDDEVDDGDDAVDDDDDGDDDDDPGAVGSQDGNSDAEAGKRRRRRRKPKFARGNPSRRKRRGVPAAASGGKRDFIGTVFVLKLSRLQRELWGDLLRFACCHDEEEQLRERERRERREQHAKAVERATAHALASPSGVVGPDERGEAVAGAGVGVEVASLASDATDGTGLGGANEPSIAALGRMVEVWLDLLALKTVPSAAFLLNTRFDSILDSRERVLRGEFTSFMASMRKDHRSGMRTTAWKELEKLEARLGGTGRHRFMTSVANCGHLSSATAPLLQLMAEKTAEEDLGVFIRNCGLVYEGLREGKAKFGANVATATSWVNWIQRDGTPDGHFQHFMEEALPKWGRKLLNRTYVTKERAAAAKQVMTFLTKSLRLAACNLDDDDEDLTDFVQQVLDPDCKLYQLSTSPASLGADDEEELAMDDSTPIGAPELEFMQSLQIGDQVDVLLQNGSWKASPVRAILADKSQLTIQVPGYEPQDIELYPHWIAPLGRGALWQREVGRLRRRRERGGLLAGEASLAGEAWRAGLSEGDMLDCRHDSEGWVMGYVVEVIPAGTNPLPDHLLDLRLAGAAGPAAEAQPHPDAVERFGDESEDVLLVHPVGEASGYVLGMPRSSPCICRLGMRSQQRRLHILDDDAPCDDLHACHLRTDADPQDEWSVRRYAERRSMLHVTLCRVFFAAEAHTAVLARLQRGLPGADAAEADAGSGGGDGDEEAGKMSPELLAAYASIAGHLARVLTQAGALHWLPPAVAAIRARVAAWTVQDVRGLSTEALDRLVGGAWTAARRVMDASQAAEVRESILLRAAELGLQSDMLRRRMEGLGYVQRLVTGAANWQANPSGIVKRPGVGSRPPSYSRVGLCRWVTVDQLAATLREWDVLGDVYVRRPHSQLIKRSADVVRFLGRQDKLTAEELAAIWAAGVRADGHDRGVVFEVLLGVVGSLQPRHQAHIVRLVREQGVGGLDQDAISLLRRVVEQADILTVERYAQALELSACGQSVETAWEAVQAGGDGAATAQVDNVTDPVPVTGPEAGALVAAMALELLVKVALDAPPRQGSALRRAASTPGRAGAGSSAAAAAIADAAPYGLPGFSAEQRKNAQAALAGLFATASLSPLRLPFAWRCTRLLRRGHSVAQAMGLFLAILHTYPEQDAQAAGGAASPAVEEISDRATLIVHLNERDELIDSFLGELRCFKRAARATALRLGLRPLEPGQPASSSRLRAAQPVNAMRVVLGLAVAAPDSPAGAAGSPSGTAPAAAAAAAADDEEATSLSSFMEDVTQRLQFLRELLSSSHLWLFVPQLDELWQCLYDDALCGLERDAFCAWLSAAISDLFAVTDGRGDADDGRGVLFLGGVVERLLDHHTATTEFVATATANAFDVLQRSFLFCNHEAGNMHVTATTTLVKSLELRGVEQLWRLALEGENEEAVGKAVTFVSTMLQTLSPDLRARAGELKATQLRTVACHLYSALPADSRASIPSPAVPGSPDAAALEEREGSPVSPSLRRRIIGRSLKLLHSILDNTHADGRGLLHSHESAAGDEVVVTLRGSLSVAGITMPLDGLRLAVYKGETLLDVRCAVAAHLGCDPATVQLSLDTLTALSVLGRHRVSAQSGASVPVSAVALGRPVRGITASSVITVNHADPSSIAALAAAAIAGAVARQASGSSAADAEAPAAASAATPEPMAAAPPAGLPPTAARAPTLLDKLPAGLLARDAALFRTVLASASAPGVSQAATQDAWRLLCRLPTNPSVEASLRALAATDAEPSFDVPSQGVADAAVVDATKPLGLRAPTAAADGNDGAAGAAAAVLSPEERMLSAMSTAGHAARVVEDTPALTASLAASEGEVPAADWAQLLGMDSVPGLVYRLSRVLQLMQDPAIEAGLAFLRTRGRIQGASKLRAGVVPDDDTLWVRGAPSPTAMQAERAFRTAWLGRFVRAGGAGALRASLNALLQQLPPAIRASALTPLVSTRGSACEGYERLEGERSVPAGGCLVAPLEWLALEGVHRCLAALRCLAVAGLLSRDADGTAAALRAELRTPSVGSACALPPALLPLTAAEAAQVAGRGGAQAASGAASRVLPYKAPTTARLQGALRLAAAARPGRAGRWRRDSACLGAAQLPDPAWILAAAGQEPCQGLLAQLDGCDVVATGLLWTLATARARGDAVPAGSGGAASGGTGGSSGTASGEEADAAAGNCGQVTPTAETMLRAMDAALKLWAALLFGSSEALAKRVSTSALGVPEGQQCSPVALLHTLLLAPLPGSQKASATVRGIAADVAQKLLVLLTTRHGVATLRPIVSNLLQLRPSPERGFRRRVVAGSGHFFDVLARSAYLMCDQMAKSAEGEDASTKAGPLPVWVLRLAAGVASSPVRESFQSSQVDATLAGNLRVLASLLPHHPGTLQQLLAPGVLGRLRAWHSEGCPEASVQAVLAGPAASATGAALAHRQASGVNADLLSLLLEDCLFKVDGLEADGGAAVAGDSAGPAEEDAATGAGADDAAAAAMAGAAAPGAGGGLGLPKCKTQPSRSAAFGVLLAMCRGGGADVLRRVRQQLLSLVAPAAGAAETLATGPEAAASAQAALQNVTLAAGQGSGSEPRTVKLGFRVDPNTNRQSATGYSGLVNLGCVCYMNSLLQQLFMIEPVRYGLLAAANTQGLSREEAADSVLLQLQGLFARLDRSESKAANPSKWCHAFKDGNGRPTNVFLQMDASEFLTLLVERLEKGLKGTPQATLLDASIKGRDVSRLVRVDGGGARYSQPQPFAMVTCQVQGREGLLESLHKQAEGDVISDYRWQEGSDEKVDVRKATCFERLPNTLTFHLKRFELNYTTFQQEKVNDRFVFPMELDMWPFTVEGMEHAERAKQQKQQKQEPGDEDEERPTTPPTGASPAPLAAGPAGAAVAAGASAGAAAAAADGAAGGGGAGEEEEAEVARPYTEARPEGYYQYRLAGVVIHVGSTDSGHYYSFIRERGPRARFKAAHRVGKPQYDARASSKANMSAIRAALRAMTGGAADLADSDSDEDEDEGEDSGDDEEGEEVAAEAGKEAETKPEEDEAAKAGRRAGRWFEFNDSLVQDFDPQRLEEEAFGGSRTVMRAVDGASVPVEEPISNNAYMLLYERVEPLPAEVEVEEELEAELEAGEEAAAGEAEAAAGEAEADEAEQKEKKKKKTRKVTRVVDAKELAAVDPVTGQGALLPELAAEVQAENAAYIQGSFLFDPLLADFVTSYAEVVEQHCAGRDDSRGRGGPLVPEIRTMNLASKAVLEAAGGVEGLAGVVGDAVRTLALLARFLRYPLTHAKAAQPRVERLAGSISRLCRRCWPLANALLDFVATGRGPSLEAAVATCLLPVGATDCPSVQTIAYGDEDSKVAVLGKYELSALLGKSAPAVPAPGGSLMVLLEGMAQCPAKGIRQAWADMVADVWRTAWTGELSIGFKHHHLGVDLPVATADGGQATLRMRRFLGAASWFMAALVEPKVLDNIVAWWRHHSEFYSVMLAMARENRGARSLMAELEYPTMLVDAMLGSKSPLQGERFPPKTRRRVDFWPKRGGRPVWTTMLEVVSLVTRSCASRAHAEMFAAAPTSSVLMLPDANVDAASERGQLYKAADVEYVTNSRAIAERVLQLYMEDKQAGRLTQERYQQLCSIWSIQEQQAGQPGRPHLQRFHHTPHRLMSTTTFYRAVTLSIANVRAFAPLLAHLCWQDREYCASVVRGLSKVIELSTSPTVPALAALFDAFLGLPEDTAAAFRCESAWGGLAYTAQEDGVPGLLEQMQADAAKYPEYVAHLGLMTTWLCRRHPTGFAKVVLNDRAGLQWLGEMLQQAQSFPRFNTFRDTRVVAYLTGEAADAALRRLEQVEDPQSFDEEARVAAQCQLPLASRCTIALLQLNALCELVGVAPLFQDSPTGAAAAAAGALDSDEDGLSDDGSQGMHDDQGLD